MWLVDSTHDANEYYWRTAEKQWRWTEYYAWLSDKPGKFLFYEIEPLLRLFIGSFKKDQRINYLQNFSSVSFLTSKPKLNALFARKFKDYK